MSPSHGDLESSAGQARKLRVLLADQSASLRQRLRTVLEQSGFVEVVGEAGRSQDAMDLFFSTKPELVVASICLPDQCGFEILRHVKRAASNCAVILTSRWADPFVHETALLLGATGVCPTSEGLAQLGGMVDHLARQPLRKSVV